MDIVKLKARLRPKTGKSYTHKCRSQGWIPSVYYGRNRPSVNIEINSKEFGALLRTRKGTPLIDLGLSESDGDSVAIIKEIQRDVLMTDYIIHVDFQHASMNEPVTVQVRVAITGTPIGVLEQEGVLNQPVQNLTVHCLPMKIPEKIIIDVSALHVGESIHVKDISMPDIEFRDSPEEVIASVTHASRIEEPVAAAAEGEAVEGAEGEAAAAEGAEGEAKPGDAKADAGKGKADAGKGKAEGGKEKGAGKDK